MRPDDFFRGSEVKPPAVVVSGDEVALGIVRDLGRERVPVLAMGPDRHGPALSSRYCAARLCADPHYDEDQLIADLETAASTLPQRAVLFPAHDDYVFAVSRHKTRLEKSFIVPVMPWERMQTLADKELQLGLAQQAGIDIPITAFIHGSDEVGAAGDAVPFPAVLKPAVPLAFFRHSGFKAVMVENRAQLSEAYARFSSRGSLLLQEVIPGPDEAIHVAGSYHDAQSRCIALFTGRKLRQHPRDFGVARLCETRWSSEIAHLALRLLSEVRYHGISDVEFKWDSRDGRFKFIEVNARQSLFGPVATAAGVNLSHIAYCDAIGRPYRGSRQRDGVRWTDALRDGPDSCGELLRGELRWREWLEPMVGVRADAYLSLRDPRPAFDEVGRLGLRLLMRRRHSRA